MKKLSIILSSICLAYSVQACAEIGDEGTICYRFKPDSAPQDDVWEKMHWKEIEDNVFREQGFLIDKKQQRGIVNATRYRIELPDGTFQHFRHAYGLLGDVQRELDFAYRGNAEAIEAIGPSTAIFISNTVLKESETGLMGTFTVEVYHNAFPKVQLFSGFNEKPGIVYEASCE